MELSDKDRENLKLLEEYDAMQWYKEVHQLSEGKGFGEQAIINDDPRLATI